jgi:hypothetical protein
MGIVVCAGGGGVYEYALGLKSCYFVVASGLERCGTIVVGGGLQNELSYW